MIKIESEDTVSRRICELMHAERKAKKLSQQTLCEDLGITQGLLSKIENNKLKPSVYVWLTFCKMFGLSPEIAMSESPFKKRITQLQKSSHMTTRKPT